VDYLRPCLGRRRRRRPGRPPRRAPHVRPGPPGGAGRGAAPAWPVG